MAERVAPPQRVYQHIVTNDESRNHFGDVHIHTKKKTRRELLLESLAFDGMYHPRELDPSEGTGEWVFVDDKTSFSSWARSDASTFWVTGKAGSGKSTLMRFLSEHKKTEALLQAWAGKDSKVVVASFFLWDAGVTMQKSQLGLMQGLLYLLLNGSKGYDVDCIASDRETEDNLAWRRPWKRKELFHALRTLIGQLTAYRRFCLFVDGLDEYELGNPDEGDYDDLVEYLDTLASAPFVKLCVSSRSWNVFKRAYGKLGQFQISMHDLNQDDIAKFIEHHLSSNPRFARILSEAPGTGKLIATVRDKAQGSFLWVSLAVKDLRRGLREYDDFATLQRTVESLPKGLTGFLQRIFRSIEPAHEILAARALILKLQNIDLSSLEVFAYSFIEELVEDTESAARIQWRPVDRNEYLRRMRHAEMSINKWCKDLLEVEWLAIDNPRGPLNPWVGVTFHTLQFPHQTILGFLRTKDEALRNMAGEDFEPRLEKGRLLLHVLKCAPDANSMRVYAWRLLRYYHDMYEWHPSEAIRLFEACDRICTEFLAPATGAHWSSTVKYEETDILPLLPTGHSVLSMALRLNVTWFAAHALSNDSYNFSTSQLNYAVVMGLVDSRGMFWHASTHTNSLVANQLLQRTELDVNRTAILWDGRRYSVWEMALLTLTLGGITDMSYATWVNIRGGFERLLALGADPHARMCSPHPEHSSITYHQQLAKRASSEHEPLLGSRYKELKTLLEQASLVYDPPHWTGHGRRPDDEIEDDNHEQSGNRSMDGSDEERMEESDDNASASQSTFVPQGQ